MTATNIIKLAAIAGVTLAVPLGAEAKEDNGTGTAAVVTAEAEGVNPKEIQTLRKHYKWKKGEKLPTEYTLEELYKVMDDCDDNTLELEDYDWQERKVVVALMVVGDKRFAKELDGRAVPVQKEVVNMLKPLWEKHHLHYPEVEALARSLEQSN